MKLVLANIINNKAFLYGETWAVVDRGTEVELDGWYICNIIKTVNEHTDKSFDVIVPLKIITDEVDVRTLVGLHYGLTPSVACINKLEALLHKDILCDERFQAWKNLVLLGVVKSSIKDAGMFAFISKVTDRLKYSFMHKLLSN